MEFLKAIALAAVLPLPLACTGNRGGSGGGTTEETTMSTPDLVKPSGSLKLTSKDFQEGGTIALKNTSYGQNLSPELSWMGTPQGTGSFALICGDPDAKRVAGKEWLHWAVVDLPPETTSLPEGAKKLPGSARQLRNDFGKETYGGPRPPAGTGVHHYTFALYALKSKSLSVKSGVSLDAIREAIKVDVIDQAKLTGTYEKM